MTTEPELNEQEQEGLPPGWMETTLGEIADVQGGVTKDSKNQSAEDEEFPYLRVANVQRGYLDLTEVKTIRIPAAKAEKLLLEPGDILFNEGGDADKLGRGWVWEGQIERCSFQNHVFRARLLDSDIQPKYISWWGNSRGLDFFLQNAKQTTNLASINRSMLVQLPINLPPLAEQVRIADKLDALLSRVEAGCERLERVPKLIKQFRQSVLSAAVSGELTREWREKAQSFPTGELEAIIQERKRTAFKGSKGEPKQALTDEEFEIPQSWIWTSLDSLTAQITDGTHFTPTYVDSGKHFISVKDIRDGKIDFSDTKFISEAEHYELCERCCPSTGDLLITKSGTIGRTAIVGEFSDFSLFVSVALLKPASGKVNMRFIDFCLQNWVNSIDISSRIVGSAIKNLHLQDMRVLAIPFPPRQEQAEIVRRVEALFAIADRLEGRYAQALASFDSLTPALLAKAFRGELVPQDPQDEPASVLLERIRAQRAAGGEKPRRGRGAGGAGKVGKPRETAADPQQTAEPKRRGRPPRIPTATSVEEAIARLEAQKKAAPEVQRAEGMRLVSLFGEEN